MNMQDITLQHHSNMFTKACKNTFRIEQHRKANMKGASCSLHNFFSGVKPKLKFHQLKIIYAMCRRVECRSMKVQMNVENSQKLRTVQNSAH